MRDAERLPLIGRDEERSQLAFAVDDVAGGSGGLVLLEAPGGFGKSALIEEMGERCEQREIMFATASAADVNDGAPFEVLDLALRPIITRPSVTGRVREGLRALSCPGPLPLGCLEGLVKEEADGREDPGGQDRDGSGPSWTYRARQQLVARLLQTLGGIAPLVLVIDDIDRGDAGLLDLVEYLLIELRRLPLLLVLARRVAAGESTGREDRQGDFLERILDRALRYEVRLLRLKLGPLTERHQRELVQARYPENHFGEALHHLLATRSKGSPRTLLEVLDLLQARNCIHRGADGKWGNEDVAQFPVPDRVEDVILSRFVDLPEADFDVLEFLATGGRRLRVRALQDPRVSAHVGTSPRGLLKKMERFVDRVPLYRLGGESFVCRYPLALEAIVREIPAWVRTVDHRLWATVLPEVTPGAAGRVARARHLLRAGDSERAYFDCLRAADALADEGSPGEALHLLDEAIDGMSRGGVGAASLERMVDLHLRRATFLTVRGACEEAIGTYQRLRPMCAALDRDEDEIRATLGMAGCQRMLCHWEAAASSYLDAAEGAEAGGHAALLTAAGIGRARVMADQERWDEALEAVTDAEAEGGGSDPAAVECHLLLAELQRRRGNLRAAERGVMAVRDEVKNLPLSLRIQMDILRARLGVGGDEEEHALAALRTAAETAAARGLVNELALATEVLGLAMAEKDGASGVGCLAEAYFLYQRTHHRPAMVRISRAAARIHRSLGQDQQALFFLEEAVALLKGACEGPLLARLCAEAGEIGLGLSKLYEAQQRFEEAVRLHLAAGEAGEAAAGRMRLAAVFSAGHKKEKAREAYAEARLAFEKLGDDGRAREAEEQRVALGD